MARKTAKQSVGKSNKKNKGYKGWKESADFFIKEVKNYKEANKNCNKKLRAFDINELENLQTCFNLFKLIEDAEKLSLGDDHSVYCELLVLKGEV